MASLNLGGIQLSDSNGNVLNETFRTLPEGSNIRTTYFKDTEKLFIGVLSSNESVTQRNLLEVENGQISYTTNPGLITIQGKFYASQPSTLNRGQRFIYEGSLTLPIQKIEDENITKGYTIKSLTSAAVSSPNPLGGSNPFYFDPNRGITFSSGGSKGKPSLRVDGELVALSRNPIDRIGVEFLTTAFGTDRTYAIVYNNDGKKEEIKPTFNIGKPFSVPLFADYKLEAKNADVQFGPFDSQFAIRLGGEYSLKSKDEKAVSGKLKIVSPDNFMQFGGSEIFRIKGSFEVGNIPIPPVFLLKKASGKGDTQKLSTLELGAEIGLAFNPLQILGIGDEPQGSFGATVGLFEGKFNTLIIDAKGLEIPLGSTPYLLTGLGGGVKDIANNKAPTKVVLQTFFESKAKTFGKDPDTKAEVAGEFSLESLGITGKIDLFPGFKNDFLAIKGFAKAEGKFLLDWSKGILSGGANVNVMSDFLQGDINFAADTKFNFGILGELKANVPRPIPLIGGKNLGMVGAGFQYINDDTFSNDFAAAWFGVNLLFTRKQFGAKVVFDGSYKFLGADGIAEAKGILNNTIGAIAKGDLTKAITTKTVTTIDQAPQTKRFLPVRFDRTQFDFGSRLGIFEPIAMAEGQITQNSRNYSFFYNGTPTAKNEQEYYLPDGAVFLSDIAKLIPELSGTESVFYVVDLDLFKQKTGKEFLGFGKVASASANIERFYTTLRNSHGVFSLAGELFKISESPDVTLKGLQGVTEAVATGSRTPLSSSSLLTVTQGDEIKVDYEAFDPDSDATITFYYDTDGTGANGTLITTDIKEIDGADSYTWDTDDVPVGNYYVYAVIDDGNNVPIVSYFSDPIRIVDGDVLPQVQTVTGSWSGGDTVDLTWESVPDLGSGYYVVSYTDIASGDTDAEQDAGTFEISQESSLQLTGLQAGDYYRFTVKAVNERGEEGLPSEPIAILVGDSYTSLLEKDEWEFSSYLGSMYVADLSLNEDQQAVLLQAPDGAMIKNGQFVWEVPLNADAGMYDVSIQIVDVFGNESVLNRTLQVSDRETSASLQQVNQSVFNIQGSSAKLEVTATSPTLSELINELGVFSVDDAQGRIDGLKPRDEGYVAKAVQRSQALFSLLRDNPIGLGNNDYHRLLSFEDDTYLRFLLVKDGTLDGVENGQVPLSSVLLPKGDTQIVTEEGNGQFRLQWEDGTGDPQDFQDLVVEIQATDKSLFLGGDRQTQTWEMFDFTNVATPEAKIAADFTIYQSLTFDNFFGFYEVLNTKGAILDTLTGKILQPNNEGYGTTAVRQRVASSVDIIVNGETDEQGLISVNSEFSGGKQYVPFVIVNGVPEQLLDANDENNPQVYSPYLGSTNSNTNSFDRFRLLGDNIFAFEDFDDRDFNDIVIKGEFQVI
jgi:Fibronectin type III domain